MFRSTIFTAICITSSLSLTSAANTKKSTTPPPVRTETWPLKESFESGIPAYISAEKGKLKLIHDHIQDGKNALRWDYVAQDTLTFKTGPLGNVNVYTGYGNYSRSTLTLRVYLPEISQSKLVVEFLAGDQVAGHYDIPMQHKGWQQIVHHYSWHSQIKWTKSNLKSKLDSIRIRVVLDKNDQPSQKYAIFDAIQYNTPRDFRDARNPVAHQWKPLSPDFSSAPQPSKSDLEKLKKLEDILSTHPNPKIKDEVWKKKIANIQKRIDSEGLKPGFPIKKNLGHYFGFMNQIANDYAHCANPTFKKQLAEKFLAVNAWMQDQGLVVDGSTGRANNYIGRTYVDAVSKMRDPLIESGQMEDTLAFIKWSYHYDKNFFPSDKPNYNKSMDYFYNEAMRLLRVALMHTNPVTRWHHVSKFRENFNQQIITTIKPDGSLFHHGMHYFAYAGGAMNSISGTMLALTNAGLPASEPAMDTVKHALMQMRWYAGGTNILLALCGRHPSGGQHIPVGSFINLAKAYAPYRKANTPPWDKQLVEAYLRFKPDLANKAEFKGFKPEEAPQGFVTMPYAGIGSQRRDTWLAGVKGFSSFVSSSESYANANRFGLYLSNGFLELLTHPKDLPTVSGSGILPDEGYNWFALDGTTTIHSTLAKIANGNGSFHEKSGGNFNGGLSLDGKNGMFIQKIVSNTQASKSREKGVKGDPFKATKSWFFFDNRIICLGSDISVNHVNFPVRTTLFQKFVTPDTQEAKIMNHKNGRSDLIDPYGNAYFTAQGDPVQLTTGIQHSRDGYDKKDTKGNYATAWIDHGKNPTSASYQYLILVQPNPEELQKFAPSSAYQVIQQDQSAHIVYDSATHTTAYAIFDEKASIPTQSNSPLVKIAPLAKVDQPCLVMIEEHKDHLLISLTYPDPRDRKTDTVPVTITLNGVFKAPEKLPNGISRTILDGKQTQITATVSHGESHTLRLNK